ncbi:MATE family efflux transporter [Vibrio cyclitrophicus]|jgi:putative MATE family efflux protein|uniref:Multidrug export protein MepA n=2 Tax=Vibrio cyclitrophicus TaxID=47951 RepID=A0A7Z1MHP5_9VIBR|nr:MULTISPECIES: MATE family efflux transporter [Vibrio]KNH14698.1 multidrug transporter [Vibrio lentus]ERM59977.1 Multi antimicrobial extrusion protein (Na(+)/drug antiporter), MATE family of MDR efflux pump [Vibrio cyclitrophicus FF75]MBE8556103.1 MATE family efflux transporter [Vibrio sp. OPT24]MBU2930738.1 MATE family efflux transporter [Vibrio cyclitrophicus]OBS96442.1 MATE family efflux transporter [Vibrio cyclitrophicus]
MSNSISRQFWRYTIPTVAAMLVNGLYQVVDGIFIGRYVGADGLAGINVAWPVIGSILGIGMLVGVGTGALVSIHQGEKDTQGAKQILATGLTLLLAITPIVSAVLFLFADNFLFWQGAEGRVYELGLQYLHILIGASVFTLGSIAMPFLLRNDDSPNLATILMIVGAVINIVLDYLFIALYGWELMGAALATAIAQFVVTALGLAYFFSHRANLRLRWNELRLKLDVIPQIFSIGTSSFFMYAYGSMMVALHNALFSQYGDQLMIGAYAILGYIVTVYYLTAEGIANGMQPLVSYNHGARNQANIRKLLKIAMMSSVLIGVAFVLLLNAFPREFVSVFNSDEPQLVEYTVLGVRLHMFALALDGFLVVAGAYYQAVNKGSKAMFVTIGNMLIQLPFLYIMPKLYGVPGIWIAYPLSNIALSVVVMIMLYKDVKKLDAAPLETATA